MHDINPITPPYINVRFGEIFHKNPAIKLEGSAAKPIAVWKTPRAVALISLGDKSET